jgi:hypothetical protein
VPRGLLDEHAARLGGLRHRPLVAAGGQREVQVQPGGRAAGVNLRQQLLQRRASCSSRPEPMSSSRFSRSSAAARWGGDATHPSRSAGLTVFEAEPRWMT